jgi:SAM-dependent methyltransferase
MGKDADQISPTGRGTRLLSGLGLLVRDRGSLRFAAPYLRSLAIDRSPLDDGIPWLAYRAVAWLKRTLREDMTVFEYGSGGSTIFFAQRASQVVSVEHDQAWHDLTEQTLTKLGLRNVTYLLREPAPAPEGPFSSTDPDYEGLGFEAYVKSIDAYPDATFDLVAVDGRARPACVIRAISKVKPGGYILLDDSDRPYYREGVEAVAAHQRLDFRGAAPYKTEPSQTTIWKIA